MAKIGKLPGIDTVGNMIQKARGSHSFSTVSARTGLSQSVLEKIVDGDAKLITRSTCEKLTSLLKIPANAIWDIAHGVSVEDAVERWSAKGPAPKKTKKKAKTVKKKASKKKVAKAKKRAKRGFKKPGAEAMCEFIRARVKKSGMNSSALKEKADISWTLIADINKSRVKYVTSKTTSKIEKVLGIKRGTLQAILNSDVSPQAPSAPAPATTKASKATKSAAGGKVQKLEKKNRELKSQLAQAMQSVRNAANPKDNAKATLIIDKDGKITITGSIFELQKIGVLHQFG